jgi:ankyrin repeat protein
VSTPHLSPAANLEQQRKLAKDLLRAARSGDAEALARIRAVRSDAGGGRSLILADAQLAVAHENGFESWAKLAAELRRRDITAFCDAVRAGDVASTRRLLETKHVRARINDPLFAFGQRAMHIAAGSEAMLTALIEAGADVHLKSDWQFGPYTVLDRTDESTARFLLARGATLTPNVAARLGWFDELQALVNADGGSVHARGGDGQQPLHEAKTVAIATFLLDRGAEIDARCIDHKSTPAQYALVDRPDVCRFLLERGALPDIFMAARLGDASLAGRLLDQDPACAAARINEPGYAPVPGFNIYCWTLGFHLSPHEVALKFGNRDIRDLLLQRSPPHVRLIDALMSADEPAANALLAEDPSLLESARAHGHLAHAILQERYEAAALMLRLGVDPAEPAGDGGTPLHAACWVGNARMVEAILGRGGVPLEVRDPEHHSTPLGWAAFGSVHRRAAGADYIAVVDRMVSAGADVTAKGGSGATLVEMARGNAAVQEALRRHGAP